MVIETSSPRRSASVLKYMDRAERMLAIKQGGTPILASQ
jgi:hypothetical protein